MYPRSYATIKPIGARYFSLTNLRTAEHNPNPKHATQQDREKVNPSADENTLSSTNDTVADNEEAAFSPNIADPQEARTEAGKGNKVNSLDTSGANPDISQPTIKEG